MYSPPAFLALLLSLTCTARAQSCVWLDPTDNSSTIPATGYSPCPSSSAASPCCADSDACLSNGYCSGRFGLYRGACTDWSAGVCPDTCPDLSFVSDGNTYYLANLYRCNGQGEEIWWCGDQGSGYGQPCQTSVGTMFSMTSLGTFLTPVPLVAQATAETGAVTTSTGAGMSTSTTSENTSSGTATAIASTSSPDLGGPIGLGVGLGLPLLATIIALTYFLMRRRGNASAAPAVPERQQMIHQESFTRVIPSEPRPEELPENQYYEIQDRQLRAELAGSND